jgi:para-nitrobenzyl esterase
VLATLSAAPQRNFTDMDRQVSANASAYWLNFVKHGNPNGEGLPRWPAFDPSAPNMLRIGSSICAGPMLSTTAADACQRQLRRCGSIPIFP